MLTAEALARAVQTRLERIIPLYPGLVEACSGMAQPERAAFLATIAHESARFATTREWWGPTEAQKGYEGRADLGNSEPGDGIRFAGRGYIMVTGRANYRACSEALGLGDDLLLHPELMEQPGYAARSSRWFWDTHGCRAPAQAGDFRRVTRIVNGGYNGYADRLALYTALLEADPDA